jgi:hypothetical protein
LQASEDRVRLDHVLLERVHDFWVLAG